MYIITASRMTSGDILKYLNEFFIDPHYSPICPSSKVSSDKAPGGDQSGQADLRLGGEDRRGEKRDAEQTAVSQQIRHVVLLPVRFD